MERSDDLGISLKVGKHSPCALRAEQKWAHRNRNQVSCPRLSTLLGQFHRVLGERPSTKRNGIMSPNTTMTSSTKRNAGTKNEAVNSSAGWVASPTVI